MGNDERILEHRIQALRATKQTSDTKSRSAVEPRPSTFTLCKESELPEKQAEATSSRPVPEFHPRSEEQQSSDMADSTFGVQSLSEAMDQAFPEANTASSSTKSSPTPLQTESFPRDASPCPTPAASKKRKAGNPVHPKIMATGQRIISSESTAGRSVAQLKMPSAVPTLQETRRTTSKFSLPVAASATSGTPNLEPTATSTPRSGSPKSVRLSDDDAISFDDSASQAILSSSGEDEDEEPPTSLQHTTLLTSGPQLVMPSVTLPAQRSFTERGKQLDRLRILVAGQPGTRKTEFIKGILDSCEHIVHTDDPRTLTTSPPFVEYKCSTKPQSTWSIEGVDMDGKLESTSDSALDYNISILELSASDDSRSTESAADRTCQYISGRLSRTLHFADLDDYEVSSILSGGGGLYPDVVYYLVDQPPLSPEIESIARLTNLTNVCLVAVSQDSQHTWEAVQKALDEVNAQCIIPSHTAAPLERCNLPLLLANLDDSANSLISISSKLLHPTTIQKLRHVSAQKFLKWRRTQAQQSLNTSGLLPNLSNLPSDLSLSALAPPIHASCSTISSPSGVLVPHPDSSFYHDDAAASPALSGHTIDSVSRPTSALALAPRGEPMRHGPEHEIKEVRLAQWALDLQRSLEEDRRRQRRRIWTECTAVEGLVHHHHHHPPPPSRPRDHSREDDDVVVRRARVCARPGPGPGPLSLDPADPLGLIALQHAWLAPRHALPVLLRLLGVGAAIGTLALWAGRDWDGVRARFGWGGSWGEEERGCAVEYALGGWRDAQSWRRGYDVWGLRGMVDRVVEEVGRLRPVGW